MQASTLLLARASSYAPALAFRSRFRERFDC